jgi:CheY-like chemotaxis protein
MAKAILLAEDSSDDELFFRLVLKGKSVKNPVKVVRDGAEAIAYLEGTGKFADREKHPLPGIIALDVRMPNLDGFAVLEWLAKNPDVKKSLLIIMFTELGNAAEIRRAYELGAHTYLTKPFTPEDLENLMHNFGDHWVRPASRKSED